jgi:hypothetical protein
MTELSIPYSYYLRLAFDEGTGPNKVAYVLLEKMEKNYKETRQKKGTVLHINPKLFQEELKKEFPDLNVGKIGCIIPTILKESGLKEEKDFYTTETHHRRNYHVNVTKRNISSIRSFLKGGTFI